MIGCVDRGWLDYTFQRTVFFFAYLIESVKSKMSFKFSSNTNLYNHDFDHIKILNILLLS